MMTEEKLELSPQQIVSAFGLYLVIRYPVLSSANLQIEYRSDTKGYSCSRVGNTLRLEVGVSAHPQHREFQSTVENAGRSLRMILGLIKEREAERNGTAPEPTPQQLRGRIAALEAENRALREQNTRLTRELRRGRDT